MERVVDRSELLSEHNTPPSSPDVEGLRRLSNFEFVQHGQAEERDEGPSEDGDEMDFLLFAPTTNNAPEVAKIRVQTPPLTTGEPGFTVPDRDESYYFAGEPSNDSQAAFRNAAITGEEIRALSQRKWPGLSYPWKVLHIQNTKRQRLIIANANNLFAKLSDTPAESKRRRPGKKARLKTRTKLAAAKVRQEESRKAAEQKEAEEREKRTRRNREKKVKKKQREKAKKVETAPAEGEQRPSSPD